MISRFKLHIVLFLLLIQGGIAGAQQLQRDPNAPEPLTRILFLVDGSGSMLAQWEGKTRMDRAKEILTDLVDSLAAVDNLELGLRVYGHQYHRKYQKCNDTKLEVPFSPNNHSKLKTSIQGIRPQGVTPLALSLEQAANDFPESDNVRNVLIMITDGLESCDGDPCAISIALQRNHIFLKPYVIGIGLEEDYQREFDCLGKFINAKDVSSFQGALNKVITQTMSTPSVRVDLLDIHGKATETNVNMSFENAYTGVTEYDYVHHILPNGVSDEVELDPVPTYNLVVHTTPKVVKRNITLDDPGLNVIKVKTPQGSFQVNMRGQNEYKNLQVIIRQKGNGEIIYHGNVSEEIKLLVGHYDVELLTMPRIKRSIQVEQSKKTTLDVQSPGRMNITQNQPGYGSVYALDKNKNATWLYNLNPASPQESRALQPGDYKLVFKARDVKTKHTNVNYFTIRQGGSTSVPLLRR